MSKDIHLKELIPAYALDCLDEEEVAQVAPHLNDCLACRAELESYRQITADLAYAAPDILPPPELHDRLLARLQPAPTKSPSRPWWQALADPLRRPVPAWSLVGVLAILLILGVWLVVSAEPASHSQEATMQTVALLGTETAPDAQGLLVIGSDGDEGGLVVEDLPALDATHQYQLWLIDRDGQRTRGAVFSVDADGYGTTMVTSPLPLTSYVAFGVTVEPIGGSPGPTGQRVLGGTF
jgi:anti-sigma-K factor RskA